MMLSEFMDLLIAISLSSAVFIFLGGGGVHLEEHF
jgi:hypothetical protein